MIFINNKYTKTYYNIIESARQNPFDGYTEKHHIIPKSLGGSNKKDNLTRLSARQHFLCHWLLTRMTEGDAKRKMWNAFWRMNNKERKGSSIAYEAARTQHSEYMTTNNPMYDIDHSGKNNHMWGKKRPDVSDRNKEREWTDKQRKHMSEKKKGISIKMPPFSKEHCSNISIAKSDQTIYTWVHSAKGIVKGTRTDLCEFDPTIKRNELTQVIKGTYKHRGWAIN